jgi:hypothetical protein
VHSKTGLPFFEKTQQKTVTAQVGGRPAPSEGHMPDSPSFLKKSTKKLLRINARSIRKGGNQNKQRFLLLFFKKRRPSFST